MIHRVAAVAFLCSCAAARADIQAVVRAAPGTPEEAAVLAAAGASRVEDGARVAARGGGWTYRFTVPPGGRCSLAYAVQGEPTVTVLDKDGRRVPSRVERAGSNRAAVVSAPPGHSLGGTLRFQFRAAAGPVAVRSVALTIRLPDSDGDGVPDAIGTLLGGPAGQRPVVVPRPDKPRTSLQSAGPYDPGVGVPVDAVLVYSTDPATMASWRDRGYAVQTMGGFREGTEHARAHPGEVQTDRAGAQIHIGGNSFYLVPTLSRIEAAQRFYRAAMEQGTTAVCPEEPEYWARAGYSQAFKEEWQARYGSPWQPPHESVDARWRAARLQAWLERRIVEAILEDARARRPGVVRMAALHSPVTYAHWAIVSPHHEILRLPALQELIGQVWTGTARTAVRNAGVRAERTFELGYLEYSSLHHLMRGTGKRLTFLMDPVEDDPNRPLEDYQANYRETLLAALLFPEIDSFEVMPWPQRIYGRIPDDYARVVNTVVGVLSDLWRHPRGQVEAGSQGIGTFTSDTMQWQRAEPAPSDFDGFYGLCLPLAARGVPVGVLSLERAADPGYLDGFRTLLVSYDFLKPQDPAVNRALADWTRRGGTLMVLGGTDAYHAVSDAWWRRAGLQSPVEDLLAQLGLAVRGPRVVGGITPPAESYVVLAEAESGSRVRQMKTLDLSAAARESGGVLVRFSDATPGDAWGPALSTLELRAGERLLASFRAGASLETRFLEEDRDSRFNGRERFADGPAFWTYRFDNLPRDAPLRLAVEVAGSFRISARPAPPPGPALVAADPAFAGLFGRLPVPAAYPLTLYPMPQGARPLYRLNGGPEAVVWQARAGQGNVVFAGVAPGFLTASEHASRWMRALARHGFELAGGTYRERSAFLVRRGPYVAVRALHRPHALEGRFVDLLSPTLEVLEDPEIAARSGALLVELGPERGTPRVAAASGRIRARLETSESTAFLVFAPSRTGGMARLWAGRRRLKAAKAFSLTGQSLPVSAAPQGDTVLLRYPNQAEGVLVRAAWSS